MTWSEGKLSNRWLIRQSEKIIMEDCRFYMTRSCLSTQLRQGIYFNSQEPVDSDDQGDIFSRQAHSTQHDHHGHQASLGHSSSSNAGSCGCEAVAKTPAEKKLDIYFSFEVPGLEVRAIPPWG